MVILSAPGSLGNNAILAEERFELQERLHGAFAVRRRVAHDQRPSVVLQRASQNLGGRGAETAGQDNERSIAQTAGSCILVLKDSAVGEGHR
jgi:hypothetical protein